MSNLLNRKRIPGTLKLLVAVLILLAPIDASAKRVLPPIAVAYPISPDGRISKRLLKIVTAQFRTALANSGAYRIVDKANQNKIIREQRECRRRRYSTSCRIEVGRLLSAAKMVTGTLMKMDKRKYYLTLVVTDLTKGLEERRSSELCRNCDTMQLLRTVDLAVGRLLGRGLPSLGYSKKEIKKERREKRRPIHEARKRPGVTDAITLFKEKKYRQALTLFQKIFRDSPNPALQLHLGNCYLRLKRYGRAMESFRRYLSLGRRLTSPQRWKAKRLFKEARRGFKRTAGRLVVEATPADAVVRDAKGRLLGQARQVIRLSPGWHDLHITRSGYLTAKRRVRITTGRSETVRVKMKHGFHHKNQFLLGVDVITGYLREGVLLWQLHLGIGLGKVVDLSLTLGGGIVGSTVVHTPPIFLIGLESRFYFLTGRYKPYFVRIGKTNDKINHFSQMLS